MTHVTAAASVNCLLVPCGPTARFTESTNCFFFEWRGEHGAPESALTISSKTFYNNEEKVVIHENEINNQYKNCKEKVFPYILEIR